MRVQLANSFINATLILSAALGSISGVNAQQLSISGSPNHPRQTEVIEVPLVEARNYIADLDQRTAEDATTQEGFKQTARSTSLRARSPRTQR